MKMKMFVLSCIAAVAAIASGGIAAAQVPNLLTNQPSSTFFGSIGNYVTSSNPNLPVHGSFEVGLGAAYQQGVNIGADLDFRYKYAITTNLSIIGESVTRNAGIAGTIVSEQAGVGLAYVPSATPDIEMSAGLLGGYRFDISGAAFTAYADIRKMTTVNTFLGSRIAVERDSRNSPTYPVLTAYTGFTF